MIQSKEVQDTMDFENLNEYKWHYLVILIVIIVLIVYCYYQQYEERNGPPPGSDFQKEGNGVPYYKGRGDNSDDIQTLLERIDWLSRGERRITHWSRLMFPTVFASIMIVLVAFRKIPKPMEFILMFITIFLFSILFHSFFYLHGDYYRDGYLRMNTDIIRSKLGLPEGSNDPGDPKNNEVPDRVFLA